MATELELTIGDATCAKGWTNGSDFEVTDSRGTKVRGPAVGLVPYLIGAAGLPQIEPATSRWPTPQLHSYEKLQLLSARGITITWRRNGVEDGFSILVADDQLARVVKVEDQGLTIQSLTVRDLWVRLAGLFE